MSQVRRSIADSRRSISTPAIGGLAKRQWGVVSWEQLRARGFSHTGVRSLVARGYLVRLHPAVYAVGHEPLRIEGRLLAALFHAGDGAALSHTTAAWWWRLIDAVPTTIHVSTLHRPKAAKGLKIHRPRQIEAVRERGLSVTTVDRTLIDVASMRNPMTLRFALAQADHRKLLDPLSLTAQLRSGQPGGRALRQALATHLPELATTDGELEIRFLLLVERAGLSIPRTNAFVEGLKVDAFWPDHKLVVELDGHATHANPVANETDRRRELILRRAGYRVVRYTWQQVYRQPEEVVADLRRLLGV
jgi:REase_MTES_1575/Transcriptional regulator, AbiEi antitoxin